MPLKFLLLELISHAKPDKLNKKLMLHSPRSHLSLYSSVVSVVQIQDWDIFEVWKQAEGRISWRLNESDLLTV